MDTKFDFQKLEGPIYRKWEDSGAFTPKIQEGVKPYVITMPPPNAYDQLHIGHALFVTLEDIMVRYHRLLGEPTLWLPGADHAGLGSQVFFEKLLQKERGISRFDLGREKFVEELHGHMSEKRKVMEGQLRSLGASCDWTRKKFTLDPDVSHAVFHTFKKMYDDGLIYRDFRIVNWCPRCGTSVSDLEVKHEETEGTLTYIKYPLVEGEEIIVATTRPETMLGDTAVAVNPADKRYKDLVGKMVKLPLMDREIPIVADEAVDMEFGTGAVKVTPAHDQTDFEIGQRHSLPQIQVIGKYGRMDTAAGPYHGLKTAEAREKVLADLEAQGLIEKQTKHAHSVGHCERCNTVIEPMLSQQWFVKIEPLAKPAIEAVKAGRIKFMPDRFEKIYLNWMENIRDWNISRQVWWGHRIPVYYGQPDTDDPDKQVEPIVVAESEAEAERLLGMPVVQDDDTLDTWFSSGLWPFTTLGWPKETPDYKYFYPTTVMETGWDIIFFWVARMIMLGIYCTGEEPFSLVYMNGLVRDKDGVKISKSKGNVVDPLVMVEKYGADALRMGLVVGAAPGNDTNISEDKIKAYRNFANKIWNAARFISLQGEAGELDETALDDQQKEWLAEFRAKVAETTRLMDNYQIALAGEQMYDYFWHTFCDKVIEESKPHLADETKKTAALGLLGYILKNSLIMLHPFVPFITEAVWDELFQGLLITESWPKA